MYIYIYIYIHIYIYILLYTYIYICISMYICKSLNELFNEPKTETRSLRLLITRIKKHHVLR